ncbi:MAG: NAD(P)H-dependent oxidoreductase subunit E, partial [Bdellovibrionota bacterium]
MSSEYFDAKKLTEIKDAFIEAQKKVKRRIILCAGTGCMAGGSMKVYDAICKELEANGLNVIVELQKEKEINDKGVWMSKSGCQGFCQMGPLLSVEPDGILYVKVKPEDAKEIVEKTILKGEAVERLLYVDHKTNEHRRGKKEIDFYSKQHRVSLDECGRIDSESIQEYIANGGYEAAAKAYLDLEPEQVCKLILDSGLRGRGGAGFPTGKKWDLTRVVEADLKYVVCNADEGDPGAFMDRSVMEGNPHSVIEGMMIAARAIGAKEGYFYVRAEYPL